MVKRIANAAILIADYMIGYHGVIICQLVYASAVTMVTVTGICAMFLACC